MPFQYQRNFGSYQTREKIDDIWLDETVVEGFMKLREMDIFEKVVEENQFDRMNFSLPHLRYHLEKIEEYWESQFSDHQIHGK